MANPLGTILANALRSGAAKLTEKEAADAAERLAAREAAERLTTLSPQRGAAETVAAAAGGEAAPAAEEIAAAVKPKKLREGALKNLNLRGMTQEDATAAALRGKHLVEGGEGSEGFYVGGPRNIQSRQDLTANRQRMSRELAERVAEQEEILPPERVGTWYDRQRQGVADIAEPYQQPRVAEAEGLFSSQTDPHGELGFALQAKNRSALGLPPGIAHTGRQAEEYASAVRENRPIDLAEKTGMYAHLSDPSRPKPWLGANDFRQAQYQGYTDPTGAPQRTGLGPTQHAFIDAESLAQVDRANRARLGGRSDWTAPRVQEIAWVSEKADDLMKQRPGLSRAEALRIASNTIADYLPEYSASATYETVPGKVTGHVPRMIGASPEEQRAYEQAFGSSWRFPEGKGDQFSPGTRNRDKLYAAADMLQREGVEGAGVYGDERNVVNIARPMVDLISPPQKASLPHFSARDIAETSAKGRTLAPSTADTIDALERFRGGMDVQEAYGWHMPMEQETRKAGTKVHGFLPTGRQVSADEMEQIIKALPPGFFPSASADGVMLFGPEGAKSQAVTDALRRTTPELERAAGVAPVRVGKEGNYGQLFKREGQAAPPGAVTSDILEGFAKAPPEVAQRVSESEGVRKSIAGKHMRDVYEEMAGQPVNQPAQKMREFFAREDWAPVVEDIRRGMPIKEAVERRGYKLDQMGMSRLQALLTLLGISGAGAIGGSIYSRALRKKEAAARAKAQTPPAEEAAPPETPQPLEKYQEEFKRGREERERAAGA